MSCGVYIYTLVPCVFETVIVYMDVVFLNTLKMALNLQRNERNTLKYYFSSFLDSNKHSQPHTSHIDIRRYFNISDRSFQPRYDISLCVLQYSMSILPF